MSARRLSSTAPTSSDREVSSVAPSQLTSNWRPVGSATALPAIWPAGSRPWCNTRVPAAFCPMPTASSGSGTWTRRCARWPRWSPTTSATAVWRARWPRNTSMRVASWGVCSSRPWPSVWVIQRSDMNPAIDHTTELRHALERSGEPGAAELLEALQALLGGAEADGPTIALTQLKRRVYRVDLGPGPGPRSLILRRSEPTIAQLNRLRSEEHTSELQSQSNLVCRLLLEKKKKKNRPEQRHDVTRRRPGATIDPTRGPGSRRPTPLVATTLRPDSDTPGRGAPPAHTTE